MGVAGQPVLAAGAVEVRVVDRAQHTVDQPLPQGVQPRGGDLQGLDRDIGRRGHPDHTGDIRCAGTDVALLPAAVQQRHAGGVAAQEQRPTPAGPPNLCAVTLIADSPDAAKPTGIWPTVWTASLCIGTSNSAAIAASSAIGMMVPTSLLAP